MTTATYTPPQAMQLLTEICPCPIRREVPAGYRPSRSAHFGDARNLETNFVYLNPNEGQHWNAVRVLAHEVGHALDYAGQHPAREVIGPATKSQSRYRQELAAVAYSHAFTRALGMGRQKRTRAYLDAERRYLERYKRARYPKLPPVIKATSAGLVLPTLPEPEPAPTSPPSGCPHYGPDYAGDWVQLASGPRLCANCYLGNALDYAIRRAGLNPDASEV